MNTLPFAAVISGFLAAAYAGRPHAAKTLARSAGASPRAAENWLQGLNLPGSAHLAALMAAHPDLEDGIIEHVRARRAELHARARQSASDANRRLHRHALPRPDSRPQRRE